LTKYYVYRVDYGKGKTLQSGWIKLGTKKMKDKINVGDRFLVYIKNKGILATGFSIREVDDNKPYNAKINLLPRFMSDFKPNDKSLEKRGKFLEISEEKYNTFKESMERSKVNDYSDLKNQAQIKGEKFEEEIYNFLNDLFTPLSDSSEVKQKVYYETGAGDGKRTFETDVFIKFKDYDILCDAFINKGEIGRKINRFNDIYGSLDQSKKNYVRFILFYKDDEENLAFDKSNLNDKTFIFDKKAKLYYRYIFETTRLPNKKPNDEPTAIAAYHFLGELKVKINDQSLIATPYLKLNDGDNLLYIFKKNIKEIIPLLYVARRERGKKKFYQRLLKRSKLYGNGSIDDYLGINKGNEREHTTFLNSIIISPEEIKESNDVIEIPFKYGSVAILDGQHRVYGAYLNALKVKKDIELYFTAIVDKNRVMLPIEAQQEYFISINMEQTKVDPEQIWRAYSELSSYKNKFNGIISQVAKVIEKDHILTIKKSIPHKENENEEKGVSFSGLCVNLEKLLTTTKLLDKNRPYTDEEINKHVDVIVKSIKNLIEVIKANFDEKDQKIFLRHDGYLSVIFRLYTKILLANENRLKSELIKPYFVALSDLLKVDDTLLNKIETSGEGPRKKSADLLASLINSRLPKGVNTLSVETGNLENPVVDNIATMLSKITTINLGKDEKGQDKYIIKHTGAWAEYGLKLNKPVTNNSEFVDNVINVLYQLLHEGGKNIPEKFKKNSVLEKIDALRTYADHDIRHGDKKDTEKKRIAAENAVYSYLTIRKVPSELNGSQLEELKIKLLNEVNNFLINLYNETNNAVLNNPQPSTT